MKDRRMADLARTIEARWPGTRVVVEPYGSPDDSTIRWWVYVLHCRRRDLRDVHMFAIRTGHELFNRAPPFITDPREAWSTAAYLARRRAEARRLRGTVRKTGGLPRRPSSALRARAKSA